ncbi:MAG: hypothetical protein CVU58_07275, partial [Deltaproteobacteria bacterium HGW-Deltaproteobacteria-16]
HGIHLPWECFFGHPFSLVINSSENVRPNLIENKNGGAYAEGKNATFPGYCFLLVDTIEKMQHTEGAIITVSGQAGRRRHRCRGL